MNATDSSAREQSAPPTADVPDTRVCGFDSDDIDAAVERGARAHIVARAVAAHEALLAGTGISAVLVAVDDQLDCLRHDWLAWAEEQLLDRKISIKEYDQVHAILIGNCPCDPDTPYRHATGCPAEVPRPEPVPIIDDEPPF